MQCTLTLLAFIKDLGMQCIFGMCSQRKAFHNSFNKFKPTPASLGAMHSGTEPKASPADQHRNKDRDRLKNMFMHKSLLLFLTMSSGLRPRREITRSKDRDILCSKYHSIFKSRETQMQEV